MIETVYGVLVAQATAQDLTDAKEIAAAHALVHYRGW